ncbi:MAG: thioredoxin-disulfide reductase [Alphaproteobacteria bacterium]|nr:thioredoxin-disulfide reductase [Alphaproteobacteria bacterium]
MIDILVIGSGPAGYASAIYGARAGFSVTQITGSYEGGQLITTSAIENYPGFAEPISGIQLMNQMKQQTERLGVNIVNDVISKVDFSQHPFVCFGESSRMYFARSVIIATGANAKWLGLESESKYKNRGISSCATCDGFFFRHKTVAVVGGGNTAAEDALYLTNFASKVYLIHRRDSLRAEKILQDRLFKNEKIEVLWNTKVDEIIGNDQCITSLKLSVNGESKEIAVSGLFVAIGHAPATEVFKGYVKTDEYGYIIVDGTKTSVEGVFAAGDCCDPTYRQAITSAGQGCKAAVDAGRFLSMER